MLVFERGKPNECYVHLRKILRYMNNVYAKGK